MEQHQTVVQLIPILWCTIAHYLVHTWGMSIIFQENIFAIGDSVQQSYHM